MRWVALGLALASVAAAGGGAGIGLGTGEKVCVPDEACELCSAHEMDTSHCAATGRKQRFRCTLSGAAAVEAEQDGEAASAGAEGGGVTEAFPAMEDNAEGPVMPVELVDVFEYRSCERTKADGVHTFILTEAMCIAIGVAALCGVSKRKRQNMNMFDRLQRERAGAG
mmetsp:Transcript_7021/g.20511  ORF Transcript_7021/g.20511 Transcript_7021/m.20511 type:complete len:168 (-) Transcript_7021:324-827(-)